jgi:poly-beta-1,6-N-acetyl-D-glucosamine synthase
MSHPTTHARPVMPDRAPDPATIVLPALGHLEPAAKALPALGCREPVTEILPVIGQAQPAVTRQVVCLIPAYNEQDCIAATVESLYAQTRESDLIVVLANNCTDATAARVRSLFLPGVVVEELQFPGMRAKAKAHALNYGWRTYCQDAYMVVGVDADTIIPPNAVSDWLAEMEADPQLGGSSSKFTMLGSDWLTRLQRSEFSRWSQTSIRRGHTSVLAGTGCAVRGAAMAAVAARDDREGPWYYGSSVEDFELTYRIRQAGWRCQVSPTVPAYTDSMKTLQALWGQRMKWSVGTVEDLLSFGINRLTIRDWGQQLLGLLSAIIRILWVLLWVTGAITGQLHPNWTWWGFTALFIVLDFIAALKIPGRDKTDVLLAVILIPNEVFAWMRAGWFLASWWLVLTGRASKRNLWAAQYTAEEGATDRSAVAAG